jgi:ribonuclease HII
MLTLVYEKKLRRQGYLQVAGVDEVGRGPLAGPLVAAAVILSSNIYLPGLNDSKLLTVSQRERLFVLIKKSAVAIGLARISHRLIDRIGIGQANYLAMKLAVENLGQAPDYLLLDGGRYKVNLPIPQIGITHGDRKVASIAAASIIAKVTRDKMMINYHAKYPEYGFDQHKGYGTRKHLERINRFGICPLHRRSFSPISSFVETA